jgi:hypothetical protein
MEQGIFDHGANRGSPKLKPTFPVLDRMFTKVSCAEYAASLDRESARYQSHRRSPRSHTSADLTIWPLIRQNERGAEDLAKARAGGAVLGVSLEVIRLSSAASRATPTDS